MARIVVIALIINAVLALAIFGAAAFIVFGLGRSPWWFVLAFVLFGACHQSVETKDGAR